MPPEPADPALAPPALAPPALAPPALAPPPDPPRRGGRRIRRTVGSPSRPTPDAWGEQTPTQLLRRRQLREAAARLFAEFGVAAVGMVRVAQAAHLGVGLGKLYYANRDELLYELLGEHVIALNGAVCTAFDAAAPEGPGVQLEAAVAAWLSHVALHRHEHRCLLFCGHLLVPDRRESIEIRLQILMETMMEPLLAATPGLAGRKEAAESLTATLASLLNDTGFWPQPPEPGERLARAQRITGMMQAAAAAEMAGGWPGLGAGGGTEVLESSAARARWREVLACVAGGTEVVIRARGKRVARVVRAG